MDYAHRNALFQRVLLISSRPTHPARATADSIRFRRFALILSNAGYVPLHACVDTISQLADLVDRFSPDLVFSAPDHLENVAANPASGGEATAIPRVNVHGWLEGQGIPYVGSPPEAIELALSKAALKGKWIRDGILTPGFISLDSAFDLSSIDPGLLPAFPCIVKPSDSGNSRGITKDSVAFDRQGLEAAVANLGRAFGHILVEHYLGLYPDFREVTCACIGNGARRILMPAELVFLDPTEIRVITTADKDNNRTEARAISDPAFLESSRSFAAAALASAGVRDYSRCDMAFADGKFWAIEVNGQPMIPDPWFEACARGAGLVERQYILEIFDAASRRLSEVSPGAGQGG